MSLGRDLRQSRPRDSEQLRERQKSCVCQHHVGQLRQKDQAASKGSGCVKLSTRGQKFVTARQFYYLHPQLRGFIYGTSTDQCGSMTVDCISVTEGLVRQHGDA